MRCWTWLSYTIRTHVLTVATPSILFRSSSTSSSALLSLNSPSFRPRGRITLVRKHMQTVVTDSTSNQLNHAIGQVYTRFSVFIGLFHRTARGVAMERIVGGVRCMWEGRTDGCYVLKIWGSVRRYCRGEESHLPAPISLTLPPVHLRENTWKAVSCLLQWWWLNSLAVFKATAVDHRNAWDAALWFVILPVMYH